MAYRRKQGMQRSATFVEDHRHHASSAGGGSASPAIASPRATRFADDSRRPDRSSHLAFPAARGDPLPSFAERHPAPPASSSLPPGDDRPTDPAESQDPVTQLFTSTRILNDDGPKYDLELSRKDDTKHGFWGLVAQKARVMLDENGTPRDTQSRWSYDRVRSSESTPMHKGSSEGRLDIGGKIKNVLEQEGLTVAEGRASGGDVVVARKLQIRRKACSMDLRGANLQGLASPDVMSPMMSDTESPQIKASRDVASAMAAKVKLLQRELKTVKADLAFSKERCAQLEEENRLLRDGNHDADEDLIRQQLETLLGEKARLAHENTVYARENRFLREIVEYHQLNMQDVVNLDDDEDDDDHDEYIEEEDEGEIEVDVTDMDAPDEQYSDFRLEEAEAQHLPAGPGTAAPQSTSRDAESPRMLSTNAGGAVDDTESPRMLSTNAGGAVHDTESPRMLRTKAGGAVHDTESPRMLSTNSAGAVHTESPRMLITDAEGAVDDTESPRILSTDSGGAVQTESPRVLSANTAGAIAPELQG